MSTQPHFADREVTRRKCHLTARQAGSLAREAGVRQIVVFHFSPRCQGRRPELEQTARQTFLGRSQGADQP